MVPCNLSPLSYSRKRSGTLESDNFQKRQKFNSNESFVSNDGSYKQSNNNQFQNDIFDNFYNLTPVNVDPINSNSFSGDYITSNGSDSTCRMVNSPEYNFTTNGPFETSQNFSDQNQTFGQNFNENFQNASFQSRQNFTQNPQIYNQQNGNYNNHSDNNQYPTNNFLPQNVQFNYQQNNFYHPFNQVQNNFPQYNTFNNYNYHDFNSVPKAKLNYNNLSKFGNFPDNSSIINHYLYAEQLVDDWEQDHTNYWMKFKKGILPNCDEKNLKFGEWQPVEKVKSKNNRQNRHSKEVLTILQKEYKNHRFIGIEDREKLAEKIGITAKQIKIWFQNCRMKEKRDAIGMEKMKRLEKGE